MWFKFLRSDLKKFDTNGKFFLVVAILFKSNKQDADLKQFNIN